MVVRGKRDGGGRSSREEERVDMTSKHPGVLALD